MIPVTVARLCPVLTDFPIATIVKSIRDAPHSLSSNNPGEDGALKLLLQSSPFKLHQTKNNNKNRNKCKSSRFRRIIRFGILIIKNFFFFIFEFFPLTIIFNYNVRSA